MVTLTFESAYFSSAYFECETFNSTDDFDFQDYFVMEFPGGSSSASASPDFSYQNSSLTPFLGDSGVSRSYSFTKTEYVYRYGLFNNITRPIYSVKILSYNGDSSVSVNGGDYIYVYIQSNFWDDLTSMGYVPWDIVFLSENQLPEGLSYDGNSPYFGYDNNGLNFLYDFGSNVYTFFPSIGSLLNINLNGNTFVTLLTSGFLVYCGFVIVKFFLPI